MTISHSMVQSKRINDNKSTAINPPATLETLQLCSWKEDSCGKQSGPGGATAWSDKAFSRANLPQRRPRRTAGRWVGPLSVPMQTVSPSNEG